MLAKIQMMFDLTGWLYWSEQRIWPRVSIKLRSKFTSSLQWLVFSDPAKGISRSVAACFTASAFLSNLPSQNCSTSWMNLKRIVPLDHVNISRSLSSLNRIWDLIILRNEAAFCKYSSIISSALSASPPACSSSIHASVEYPSLIMLKRRFYFASKPS